LLEELKNLIKEENEEEDKKLEKKAEEIIDFSQLDIQKKKEKQRKML
jgi:hypothetical protein